MTICGEDHENTVTMQKKSYSGVSFDFLVWIFLFVILLVF